MYALGKLVLQYYYTLNQLHARAQQAIAGLLLRYHCK
jgi:hypothetical protein